jgi:GAF domain-containing protein/HAMP domain-containing protein
MKPVEKPSPARSRKATPENNASLVALLLLVASAANAIINFLNPAEKSTWQTLTNAIAPAFLSVMCIVALVLSRRKKVQQAAYIIVFVVLASIIMRTLVNEGLGLIFGIGAVAVTSIVGFLILPPSRAGNTILLGLFLGAAIILTDLYWPFARPIPTIAATRSAYITVGTLVTFFAAIILMQFRHFSLYPKFLLSITLAAMLPVIVTGVVSSRLTRSALTGIAEQTLLGSAQQAALSLDSFTSSNLDAVRTDAQSPAFQKYLSTPQSGETDTASVSGNAIATLQALGRKDQVFIKSYALLDRRGVNRMDTDAEGVGDNEASYDYFSEPLATGVPFASPVYVSPDGKAYLVFSSPVRNAAGEMVGVLRVRYDAAILQQIIAQQNGLAGETSFGILLDENNIILADGASPSRIMKTLSPLAPDRLAMLQAQGQLPVGTPEELSTNLPDLEKNLNTGKSNFYFDLYGLPNDVETAAVTTVGTNSWRVVFIQDDEIFLAPVEQQTRSTIILAVLIILVAALGTFGLSRRLTIPVQNLTKASEQIAEGDLNVRADVETEDEIGTLAAAFNSMTARLRDMIENLETRAAERTVAIERRTVLLQAAADIGHSVASTRDIKALLTQTAHLISQRFGFYHVGIFLLDERGEFAVLQAANSEGGRRMLERGHKLRVGQTGIVGYVTAQGQARIALDVGDDAIFFDNPDLPQTRSEMSLPLIASDVILGALDVQSEKAGAFGEEDIATLQVMADQIAVAFENARLFTEGQAAIESTRRAYGEVSRKGWQQWLSEEAEIGYYISSADKITPTAPTTEDQGFARAAQSGQAVRDENGTTVFVPLHVRGEAIGALRLAKPSGETWSDDELALTNTLAGQMGAALESARLYEETASRAERERTVTEITTRIRGVTDPQTMLETAMEELKQILGAKDIHIRSLTLQKNQETRKDHTDQSA